MNIVVYCGSTDGVAKEYEDSARILGTWIGKAGHTLVWGGCKTGLMGIVGDAALEAGADVVGVLPDIPKIQDRKYERLTRCIETGTLAQRKQTMIDMGDAFVSLVGGPGTVDEAGDIVALLKANVIDAPCVFVNTNGYYNELAAFYKRMIDEGFCRPDEVRGLLFSDNMDEIAAFIEGYGKSETY